MSEDNWVNDPEQVKLFQARAESVGMNRRTFLKILAAAGASSAILAACGGPAAAPTTAAPKPTTAATTGAVQPPAGGAKVPDAEQVFRDGVYMPDEPASMDF